MLHEFLTANREELIERCRAKVRKRPAPRPTETELRNGIPLFLEQLIKILRVEQTSSPESHRKIAHSTEPDTPAAPSEIGQTAASHGHDLLRQGFTVDQVVHDYGDLCQAVTELAVEQHAPIATDEFRTLNLCLDNAIAGAVTEYVRQHDQLISEVENERLGFLAHELRNLLNSAVLAVSAVKSGKVGLSGATGAVLDRSLLGLRALIDRSLAEVRLSAGISVPRSRLSVSHPEKSKSCSIRSSSAAAIVPVWVSGFQSVAEASRRTVAPFMPAACRAADVSSLSICLGAGPHDHRAPFALA